MAKAAFKIIAGKRLRHATLLTNTNLVVCIVDVQTHEPGLALEEVFKKRTCENLSSIKVYKCNL